MNNFTLIRDRFRARSLKYTCFRFVNLFRHYGMTPAMIAQVLDDFVRLLTIRNICPTFPVTAMIVHRHPQIFQRLQDKGVEFAIHGYRHIDYTQISSGEFRTHIEKAIHIFRNNSIHYKGFRFPFLRRTPKHIQCLSEYDFLWDSSEVISWPLPSVFPISDMRRHDYQQIIHTYQVQKSQNILSLPWIFRDILEIPVSVPDDDILSERLGMNVQEMHKIWRQILEETYERGDLFVLQLHPERFLIYRSVLARLLNVACRMETIWIASLSEIARWWKDRYNTVCDVTAGDSGAWKIHSRGPAASRIRLGVCRLKENKSRWTALPSLEYNINTVDKPVIGILPPIKKEMIDFLRQEGYLFEEARKDQAYAMRMAGDSYSVKKKQVIIRKIESVNKPLLKLHYWPDAYQSAISVTGDVDGVDFWDYWTRFYGK